MLQRSVEVTLRHSVRAQTAPHEAIYLFIHIFEFCVAHRFILYHIEHAWFRNKLIQNLSKINLHLGERGTEKETH